MRAFLQSLDEKVWLAVEVGWKKLEETPTSWDDTKIKAANFDSRALNALFSAVTNENSRRSLPLTMQRKHRLLFKIPTRAQKLLKTPNSKGLLPALRK